MTGWSIAHFKGAAAWIDRLSPAIRFVDCGFPYHRAQFIGVEHDVIIVGSDEGSVHASLFTQYASDPRNAARRDLQGLIGQLRSRDKEPWLLADTHQLRRIVTIAASSRLPGLTFLESETQMADVADFAQNDRFKVIAFTDGDGNRTGDIAWIPEETCEKFGLEMSDLPDDVAIEAPAGSAVTIKAANLISDCPWPAEGDEHFSWQWTGPGITHRIFLGALPREIHKLAIHFMDHPAHQDIQDNLLFQLNGRQVEFDEDLLTPTGGTARLDIPDWAEPPLVVGICAFPEAVLHPGETRHLRVCMLAVEALS